MKLQELFTDESKWTQGVSARNEDGAAIDYQNKNAVCFCFVAGIMLCYPEEKHSIGDKVRFNLKRTILSWNDSPERTFSDIRKLIEELDI